jgi:hypothetical protein
MDLPKQKNFYDNRRQFQGRDQPTDVAPEPAIKDPMPKGQILFGLIFLAFVAFLAYLRVKSAREELAPMPAPAPAAAPAKK